MIVNASRTVMVDGANMTNPMYKRNESEVVKGQFYIMNEESKPLGAFAYAVTDKVVGYIMKPIVLHEATVYDVSGVSTPGDVLVYLSSGTRHGSVDELKNSIIASAYADTQGNFKFTNISDASGSVVMWISTWPEYISDASLTYKLSVVNYDPDLGELLTYSFKKPEDKNNANPIFTITGTCTEDVEKVYVSCVDSAKPLSVAYLMETLCKSVESNYAFTIEYNGEYDQDYVVWGLSKIGGRIAVDKVTVSNNTADCLSGDTMITMIDGTTKRMDRLSVGDVVLSDGGVPTKIHTIRHGHFNDYHILYHFEDGTVIDETHQHRFYNVEQGFWQRLQRWNIGDHAINKDGAEIALVSVERLEEKAEMFGIWTDSGTYYANGLLSGAAFCNKNLLEEATAEQAVDMMLSADEEWLVQLMGLEGVLP